MSASYYDLLGVAPSADQSAIEAAYKRQVRIWHPDRNRAPEATERMKALNIAYDTLRDAQRRQEYDALLAGGGAAPTGGGAAELLWRAWSNRYPAQILRGRYVATMTDGPLELDLALPAERFGVVLRPGLEQPTHPVRHSGWMVVAVDPRFVQANPDRAAQRLYQILGESLFAADDPAAYAASQREIAELETLLDALTGEEEPSQEAISALKVPLSQQAILYITAGAALGWAVSLIFTLGLRMSSLLGLPMSLVVLLLVVGGAFGGWWLARQRKL